MNVNVTAVLANICVVNSSTSVSAAVAGLMLAKMRNGGAACTAANRVYVQKSIADQFTKEFSQAMSQLKMGRGTDAGIQLGASVSVKERNKIAELVDGARVHLSLSHDAGIASAMVVVER